MDGSWNRLRVGAHPIIEGFSWLPPSGGTSHHWAAWLDGCWNRLRAGAHPIMVIFLAAFEWGHIPSSGCMVGSMAVLQNVKR